MTEKEKMLAGMVYDATTPELIADLQATREALHEFNMLRPSETQQMKEILRERWSCDVVVPASGC